MSTISPIVNFLSIRGEVFQFIAQPFNHTDGDFKKLKVIWFGRLARPNGTLVNSILQSIVDGGISRGWPTRQWLDDVKEWTWLSLNEMWRKTDYHMAWESVSVVLCFPKRTEHSIGLKFKNMGCRPILLDVNM